MRALGNAVLDFVIGFIENRPTGPAEDRDRADPLALTSNDIGELLRYIGEAAQKAVDPAGPGYLAYIPGGGLYSAALADLITASINRYVSVAALAPALVGLEQRVIRWIADLFDFPPEAEGILTTGGSLANFSAVVTARHALDAADGTIYVDDQAHHSIAKAAALAGFPTDSIRTVATDDDLRMDPAALEDAIERDKKPFLVVASAGTTNTGAVDPLDAVADIARDRGLWLHVDAAYGGFFQLTDRGRQRQKGIERADSITLDPHKAMFLPYGTGCLLVREGRKLKAAHTAGAEYMQDLGDVGLPNYADYSPELSRELRGLRIWLPLQLHGQQAFERALDEKLDLAAHAYAELKTIETLDLPWEPQLTVVPFRHPDGARVLAQVNDAKRVFLSSTTIRGLHTLRIAILSHRTHLDRVHEAIELIRKAAT
jgi:aromatic-L-amino-acid decarboxylase